MFRNHTYPKRKRYPTGGPKRHTHRTAAGIEDAIAALLYAQQELNILNLRVDRALTILREVRSGPHAYNPDQPAKLVIRRR